MGSVTVRLVHVRQVHVRPVQVCLYKKCVTGKPLQQQPLPDDCAKHETQFRIFLFYFSFMQSICKITVKVCIVLVFLVFIDCLHNNSGITSKTV